MVVPVIILSLVLSVAAGSSRWAAPHLPQTDSSLSPLRVAGRQNYRCYSLNDRVTGRLRSFNFLDKGLSCSVSG